MTVPDPFWVCMSIPDPSWVCMSVSDLYVGFRPLLFETDIETQKGSETDIQTQKGSLEGSSLEGSSLDRRGQLRRRKSRRRRHLRRRMSRRKYPRRRQPRRGTIEQPNFRDPPGFIYTVPILTAHPRRRRAPPRGQGGGVWGRGVWRRTRIPAA